jgi:hypothetical protein
MVNWFLVYPTVLAAPPTAVCDDVVTHIASSQCTILARKDLHKCLRAHGAEDHVRGTRSIPSHAAMSRRPYAQDYDTQETS